MEEHSDTPQMRSDLHEERSEMGGMLGPAPGRLLLDGVILFVLMRLLSHVSSLIVCLWGLFAAGCTATARADMPPQVGPTVAPAQAATGAPNATYVATQGPRPTPSRIPTPDLSRMKVESQDFLSPDGTWVMTSTRGLPFDERGIQFTDYAYDHVKVYNAQTQVEWVPIERWSHYGLGFGIYVPLLWTPDARFLYMTYKPVPAGCAVFVNGSDLWRLDLYTGSFIPIVAEVGLWLSLSPDQTSLAYIGYGDRGLVIQDLGTGHEQEVKLDPGKEYDAGHIVWSPDGRALILTLAFETCGTKPIGSTSVLRIDLAALEHKTLIHEDERAFTSLEWWTPDQVLLTDHAGKPWWLDPNTGKLTAP